MKIFVLLLLLFSVVFSNNEIQQVAQRLYRLSETEAIQYAKLVESFPNFTLNSELVELASQDLPFRPRNQLANGDDPFNKFTCDVFQRSGTPPTSADKVRICDLDLVAALGDSITAGFGALAGSIFTVFTEYRGVSWSIGGDLDKKDPWGDPLYTMPNIVRKYSPNLKGFSTGTGKADSSNSRYNRAVSGAIAKDIPGQASQLVGMIQKDAQSFANDWKLVTLWIGGNDLCDVCNGKPENTPANYTNYIIDGLRILKQMPRTIVSLAGAIDVTKLYPLSSGFCSLLHSFECKCGTTSDSKKRAFTSDMQKEYNKLLKPIPAMAEFNDRDDFVVIYQPLYENVSIPLTNGKPDKLYFAPDCFHFSGVGQEAAAIGLWNNLIEPTGAKRLEWKPKDPIECPKTTDYIWNHRNSQ